MFGFEAIAHHNGWIMALTGALIVFTGLTILSLAISCIPKLMAIFENRIVTVSEDGAGIIPREDRGEFTPATTVPSTMPLELAACAEIYDTFIQDLGQCFPLTSLYQLCRQKEIPHPHITISALRQAGYLTAEGDGQFSWKSAL